MPQIAQISEIFASQLFWLLLTFGLIYFVIGRGMLPKIEATVDARDSKIAGDLAAAEAARAEADRVAEANRLRTEQNRAEAQKVTQAAKDASARANEQRLAAADSEIDARVTEAEVRIRTAADSALAEIQGVAAEAAQDMVAKLSGATVSRAQAEEAVRTALANG
jgi:F-type H+-transporting ATPase subunit b